MCKPVKSCHFSLLRIFSTKVGIFRGNLPVLLLKMARFGVLLWSVTFYSLRRDLGVGLSVLD